MKNTTTTIFAFIYVIENSMNFQNKKKSFLKISGTLIESI